MPGVEDCRFASETRGGDGLGRALAVGLAKGEGAAGRWQWVAMC